MFSKDLARMYAYLPIKLSELSKVNPNAVVGLIQDWGDGKKDIRKLWKETTDLIDAATSNESA